MKFWKKAVSALLAAVIAGTMLFTGSVTASAASDDVYVDVNYNTNGECELRIGGYGLSDFSNFLDFFDTLHFSPNLYVILVFDNFSIHIDYAYDSTAQAYLGIPYINYGDGIKYDEKEAFGGLYNELDRDGEIVVCLPKGSKAIDKVTSAQKVILSGGIFVDDVNFGLMKLQSLSTETVKPNFSKLQKESTSEKNDSSSKEATTTGKLPKTAKTGTPMPEYTIEGYYTSKNEYRVVLGGIPEEEYEYLKACEVYFKEVGFINFDIRDHENWSFNFGVAIKGDYNSCYFEYGSSTDDRISGEGTLEKSDGFYTYTFTFSLNSAAKKAIEKLVKKTKTGKMEVGNYYSIWSSSSSAHVQTYNYYRGKNSYSSKKIVSYNFSNEIKKETTSSTEIELALKTTTLTAKKSIEKVKLSWKMVDGAEKYQIYYREKGESKYKKLTTVSAGKTSYSTSKLDKNKTYEFKIRSYAESGGKKVYSKYSKTVTVG